MFIIEVNIKQRELKNLRRKPNKMKERTKIKNPIEKL